MRCADFLRLSLLEIKLGRKALYIGFFLMLLLFSVCFLIYYFSYSFMDNLSLYIMKSKPEMETVEYVVDDPLAELDELKKLGYGAGDVSMISGLNYHVGFFTEDRVRLDIDSSSISVRTFQDDNVRTIAGNGYSAADNTAGAYGVWISPELAGEYDLDVGSRLSMRLGVRELAVYEVAGILPSEMTDAPMTVPLCSAVPICRREGLYMPALVTLNAADPASYFAVKKHVEEKGAALVSRFELVYAVTDLISDLFRIFSVMCFVIAMTCLINCCRIFISSRKDSIILLRTLGMQDRRVMAVYSGILNIMFAVSYFSALVIFVFFRSSFRNTYNSLLGVSAAENGNMAVYILVVFLIGAAAVNLIFMSKTRPIFSGKDMQILQSER